MVTGYIYHSEIPKTAQCETRERAKRAVGRNETRYSARRFMGGNGEGDRTERGMEGGGKEVQSRRETVFVSQVSRTVHGHGDRPVAGLA